MNLKVHLYFIPFIHIYNNECKTIIKIISRSGEYYCNMGRNSHRPKKLWAEMTRNSLEKVTI